MGADWSSPFTKVGMVCKEQHRAWACVRCARMKVGCPRGEKHGKRKNAASPVTPKPAKRAKVHREVVYTSSEDERNDDDKEPIEKPALKPLAPKTSAPMGPQMKKGKSKGISTGY